MALNGIGFVFGEVMSMGVLFNLTKTMSYYRAFAITASIILAFSIYFLITVVDPQLITLRTGKTSRHSLLAIERRKNSHIVPNSDFTNLNNFDKTESKVIKSLAFEKKEVDARFAFENQTIF